jgi:lysozyme family protein
MDANFDVCLAVVLASEGGFVDDPNDPGGATNLGVTLTTLSGWLGRPATIAEVEALTPEAVAPIYRQDYWQISGCPDWPAGVDLMVFDCAVNAGVARAVRTLQSAIGVAADGIVGPATKAAVAASNRLDVIGRMATIREAFYHSLPTFGRFGKGWIARVERTKDKALEMAA